MSSFTDKAKQVLATVAPILGTAIGGPIGAAAGALIAKTLGVKDVAEADAVLQNATPEQLLALKNADNQFKKDMEQLGFDKEKLAYDDTANARAMSVATKDGTPRNLSYGLLAFTGTVILAIVFGWAKLDSALAGTVLGYLVSECKAMMQFWFGTTKSSQNKDDTIAEIAKGP
jgi:gas vesicle protein